MLCDEQAEESDLIAFVGLDSYDPAPKPYKAFSRKEVASVLHKNQLGVNMMYDREISKLRQNKDSLRSFLYDQQKWLSNMKTDINKYKNYSSSNVHGLGMHAFYPRQ